MKVDFGALARSDSRATLLVGVDGRVFAANPSAVRRLGLGEGADLLARLDEKADALAFLRACSGGADPLIGALTLLEGEGSRRVRCEGAAVQPSAPGQPAVVVLRLREDGSAFGALTDKIDELNAEIVRRRGVEADLKRALEDKEVLLRELHHRVKNNLQTIASIFSLAIGRERDDFVRGKLATALGRIDVMARVQKTLYEARDVSAVSARELLSSIGLAVQRLFDDPAVALSLELEDVLLSPDLAMPLCLLTNELLTNAYKHAFGGRPGAIRLRLVKLPDSRLSLTVEDDGRGVGEPSDGLGLTLARALAGQIGGALAVEPGPGARFGVVFPLGAAAAATAAD